jgi:hypothetical protein
MGQWNISIHGTGIHHNTKQPDDANRLAAEFVKQLRAKGHTVTKATITYGGEEDVTDAEAYEESYRKADEG